MPNSKTQPVPNDSKSAKITELRQRQILIWQQLKAPTECRHGLDIHAYLRVVEIISTVQNTQTLHWQQRAGFRAGHHWCNVAKIHLSDSSNKWCVPPQLPQHLQVTVKAGLDLKLRCKMWCLYKYTHTLSHAGYLVLPHPLARELEVKISASVIVGSRTNNHNYISESVFLSQLLFTEVWPCMTLTCCVLFQRC